MINLHSILDATELAKAYELFQILKRLLVDLILRSNDKKKKPIFFQRDFFGWSF